MKLSRGAVAVCVLLSSFVARVGDAAPDPAPSVAEPVAPPPVPARAARSEGARPAVPAPAASPASSAAAARGAAAPMAPSAAAGPSPTAVGSSPTLPPAAAASSPGVPPAGAAKPTLDGATYAVRLRDLEARVDELKEQIRRSHTRLSLLSDTILSGGAGGARASIIFQNDMSGAFRVTRALFVLDGAVQYNKQDDTGALSGQKQIPIFKGSISPGDHTLQVLIRLRGHGYGVFSYLRGYQFEVKQSHSFTVTEGKQVDLDVIAWEKGGVTTPLEQRPAVRYLERLRDMPAPGGSVEPGEAQPASRQTGGKD
jgi:hypothetical protein